MYKPIVVDKTNMIILWLLYNSQRMYFKKPGFCCKNILQRIVRFDEKLKTWYDEYNPKPEIYFIIYYYATI